MFKFIKLQIKEFVFKIFTSSLSFILSQSINQLLTNVTTKKDIKYKLRNIL